MGSVTMTLDGDDDYFCPLCGQEMFNVRIFNHSGPDSHALVCQACDVGWPIQEDD